MFHIETPILRGAGGEGHQLSFRVTDAQGHIYVGRGKGWVEQAVCILKFTLSLQGAQIKTSECGHAALASGPALAAVGGCLSVHLGCAAARAGGALSAADAVGRTAVLRGWRRGRDLLPSCRLPCVGVDVPQGPRQERSDHKRCKRNAHHGECVQAMENLWRRRRNWTGILSAGNIFFIVYLEDHSQGLGECLLILHHGPDHGGIERSAGIVRSHTPRQLLGALLPGAQRQLAVQEEQGGVEHGLEQEAEALLVHLSMRDGKVHSLGAVELHRVVFRTDVLDDGVIRHSVWVGVWREKAGLDGESQILVSLGDRHLNINMLVLCHREDPWGGHQKEVCVIQLHVEGSISIELALEATGIPQLPQAAVKHHHSSSAQRGSFSFIRVSRKSIIA